MGQFQIDYSSFWVIVSDMNKQAPDLSNKLTPEEVHDFLINHYGELSVDWVVHQWTWINTNYKCFNDLIKYLISIYFVQKTLEYYFENGITISYEKFYSDLTIQIEKINISSLSKEFNLPKETMRRKIQELEDQKVIIKKNRNIILDREAYDFIKPIRQIKVTANYLHNILKIMKKEGYENSVISTEDITDIIKANFSRCWLWFYQFQIPNTISWKDYFNDINEFYIMGTCWINQVYNTQNKLNLSETTNKILDNVHKYVSQNPGTGLNAMSISEMTSLPRATVIRKNKNLIKKNFLHLDENKHYVVTYSFSKATQPLVKDIKFKNKAVMIAKLLNLVNI